MQLYSYAHLSSKKSQFMQLETLAKRDTRNHKENYREFRLLFSGANCQYS